MMKYKERLEIEHPENVGETYIGGCIACPGSERNGHPGENLPQIGINCFAGELEKCRECWNTQILDAIGADNRRIRRFKVGDTVTVKQGLVSGDQNGGGHVNGYMVASGGQKFTVSSVLSDDSEYDYGFTENPWIWKDEWLESEPGFQNIQTEIKEEKKVHEYKVGDTVEFVNEEKHNEYPFWYPKTGTIGNVLHVKGDDMTIKWPGGSTSIADIWGCRSKYVRPAKTNHFPKLQTGMVVEFRNGVRCRVFLDTAIGDVFAGEHYHNPVSSTYLQTGKNHIGIKELDVIKVFEPTEGWHLRSKELNYECLSLIWQESQPRKMTKAEIEAALGYEIEIAEE